MLIGFLALAVIAVYVLWRTSRGRDVPDEVRELEGRVKRSIAGSANPIPGVNLLRTQTSNDFFVGPVQDEIGPDESHICSVDPGELSGQSPAAHLVQAAEASSETRKAPRRGASGKKASSSAKRRARPATSQTAVSQASSEQAPSEQAPAEQAPSESGAEGEESPISPPPRE